MRIERTFQRLEVKVLTGTAVSPSFDFGDFVSMLVKVPASGNLEAATLIRLEAGGGDSDFAAVNGIVDLTPAAAAKWFNPDIDGQAYAAGECRIRTVNAAGADVVQTADRTFAILLKG